MPFLLDLSHPACSSRPSHSYGRFPFSSFFFVPGRQLSRCFCLADIARIDHRFLNMLLTLLHLSPFIRSHSRHLCLAYILCPQGNVLLQMYFPASRFQSLSLSPSAIVGLFKLRVPLSELSVFNILRDV